MDMKAAKDYLIARANELSTWQGIVLMLTALGAHLSSELQTLIVTAGIGFAGFLGSVFPDLRKKPDA